MILNIQNLSASVDILEGKTVNAVNVTLTPSNPPDLGRIIVIVPNKNCTGSPVVFGHNGKNFAFPTEEELKYFGIKVNDWHNFEGYTLQHTPAKPYTLDFSPGEVYPVSGVIVVYIQTFTQG